MRPPVRRGGTDPEVADLWIVNALDVNAALRGDEVLLAELEQMAGPDEKIDHQRLADRLDAAMRPLRRRLVLYRGVSGGTDLGADAFGLERGGPRRLVGREYVDRGFVSTSTDPSVARQFGNAATLRIHVRRGVPHLDLRDLNSQKEVLLGRGLRHRVTGEEMADGRRLIDVEVFRPGLRRRSGRPSWIAAAATLLGGGRAHRRSRRTGGEDRGSDRGPGAPPATRLDWSPAPELTVSRDAGAGHDARRIPRKPRRKTMSTTRTPEEQVVYRAVHRGSLEVVGIGVPGALRARFEDNSVDPEEVAFYTTTHGRLEGLVAGGSATVLGGVTPLRNTLRTQRERDAEQARLNGLDDGDTSALRIELVRAADAAHEAFPQYRHHWDRWLVGRMAEDHEAAGSEVRAGDLVLYLPTPHDRYGSPVTVYAIRAGVDIALPPYMAEAVERIAGADPKIEDAPGSADVAYVRLDGVLIGSATRVGEASFVAKAFPATVEVEYTVGSQETAEDAVAAVVAEWEVGWPPR